MVASFLTIPRELRDTIYNLILKPHMLEPWQHEMPGKYICPELTEKDLSLLRRYRYSPASLPKASSRSYQHRGKKRRRQQSRKLYNFLLVHPRIFDEAWSLLLEVCVLRDLSLAKLVAKHSTPSSLHSFDYAIQQHCVGVVLDVRNYSFDSEKHLCRLAIQILGLFQNLRQLRLHIDTSRLPPFEFLSRDGICHAHHFKKLVFQPNARDYRLERAENKYRCMFEPFRDGSIDSDSEYEEMENMRLDEAARYSSQAEADRAREKGRAEFAAHRKMWERMYDFSNILYAQLPWPEEEVVPWPESVVREEQDMPWRFIPLDLGCRCDGAFWRKEMVLDEAAFMERCRERELFWYERESG